MSVQEITEYAFGNASFGDQFSQTVTYQVIVEDGDGPNVIRRDPFFRRGKPYSFRNDSNPLLGLSSLSIRHDSQSRTRFFVDATFTSAEGKKQQDNPGGDNLPNDESTLDEPQQAPTYGWELRVAYFRRRAESAKFQGVYVQEAGTRARYGDRLANVWDVYVGPPLHSNRKAVEPTPEYDESGFVIRQIGTWPKNGYQTFLDQAAKVPPGAINANQVTLRNPSANMQLVAAAGTLRFDQLFIPQHYGNEPFIPVEVEWIYKPGGWHEDIPDVGKVIKIEEVSGAGDVVAEMHADEALIRDSRGEALAEDSPLDGSGNINRGYDAMQFYNRWILGPVADSFPSFWPYNNAWS